MLYNGTILISFALNKDNRIITKPVISSKGFFNNQNIKIFENNLKNNIHLFLKELNNKKFIDELIKEKINTFTRKFFKKSLDMKPIIEIHIIKI